MSRACTICTNPQRDAIDAAIRAKESPTLIGRQFGVTRDQVRRHAAAHVPVSPLAESPKRPEAARSEKRVHGGRLTLEERQSAQALFLADFAHYGLVRHALDAADVNRSTLYQWKEHDDDFALRYQQAELDANDALRLEARRRGVEGTPSYVVNRGEIVMVTNDAGQRVPLIEQKYSDTLLIFEMKRRMPEYREKQSVEISGKDGGPIQQQQTVALDVRGMTPEQLAALRQVLEYGNDSQSR